MRVAGPRPKCPLCHESSGVVKAGFTTNKNNATRTQKYRCQWCKKYFTPDARKPEPPTVILKKKVDSLEYENKLMRVALHHISPNALESIDKQVKEYEAAQ